MICHTSGDKIFIVHYYKTSSHIYFHAVYMTVFLKPIQSDSSCLSICLPMLLKCVLITAVPPKDLRIKLPFLPKKRKKRNQRLSIQKPSLVSYRPLYVTAYEVYQRDVLNELLTLKPRTHKDVLENATKTKNVCFGDRRLQKIRKYLDAYPGWERSLMQKQFHEKFLQAVCIHLYKDDADVDVDKVMRINEWENLKQQVLCVTPRRFGKTTSVSMFVAAYGMTVEKVQSVYLFDR